MKQATLFAIISICILIITSLLRFAGLPFEMYKVLQAIDVLSCLGLLYFFVQLYKKQSNGV